MRWFSKHQDNAQPQGEKIEDIKARFPDEWLLIEVTKVDKINQPLEGRLLAHTPNREEIWRVAKQHEGDLLIEFAGAPIPEGWGALL